MRNRFIWASALALAFVIPSPTEAQVPTNGVILISTRNPQDTFWGSEFVTDEKGPGQATPGDVGMVDVLGDYGYSCRLILDRLLGPRASEVAGVGDPGVFYGPIDTNFVPILVIMSGSGASADTPPPPTNAPVMMGEHVCLGNNSARQGSIYMYNGTSSNDPNQGTGATKYMKVVAPNHPIMQGIPLDSEGRVKIFRDKYPDEDLHVPPGGKSNYEYRWCTQSLADVASCTTVLGVLAGTTSTDDSNRVCFAVADVGGTDANSQTVLFRRVHLFLNEQGSGGPRRVFNALTIWGRILFVRACKWAMGETLTPFQGLGVIDVGQVGPSSIKLSWQGSIHSNYRIDGTTDFVNWAPIVDDIPGGTSGTITRTLNIAAAPQAVYMRVAALP